MSAGVQAACALLPWDSAFFGRRIARLEPPRPAAADLDRALGWAAEQRIDCLYALVDADSAESVRALESRRFELMDVRLTLDRVTAGDDGPSAAAVGCVVDVARTDDADALAALARESHTGTRFTEDPRFGRDRAADLYAAWVTNALAQPDARVLVVRDGAQPAAYLVLQQVGGPVASIGLVAVRAASRRRAWGQALAADARREAHRAGAARISVVTQGGNPAAVRFYERCGFTARACQFWYHRWFTS